MKRIVRNLLIAAFWIAVWWAAAWAVRLKLLLPGPGDTLAALARLIRTAAFWRSTGMTLLRVAAGYSLAVVSGVALAAACHWASWLDALLSPLRTIIKATPVSSFIFLVLLWMQRVKGRVPVLISFLMVLPMIWTAVQEALGAVDGQWIEMAHAYGLNGRKRLRYLYAPAVRPQFLAACMTGMGFAWKAGIAAEAIAQPALSIGQNLYNAQVYLERAELFAWTLTVILLSIALEAALKAFMRRKGAAA